MLVGDGKGSGGGGKPPPKLVEPAWLEDGAEVYAPLERLPDRINYALCRALVVSGYHVRVRSELRNLEGWFHLDSLRVTENSPYARHP